MTIRVCHNSFRKFTKYAYKTFIIFIKLCTIVLIIASLILSINEPIYHGFGFVFGALGILVIFYISFLIPLLNDEPNILMKLNRRFKLFSWREDC